MSINQLECSICLGIFPDTVVPVSVDTIEKSSELLAYSKDAVIKTKCNHVFHNSCLHRWLEESRYKTTAACCPNCRKELMKPAIEINNPQTWTISGIVTGLFAAIGSLRNWTWDDLDGALSGMRAFRADRFDV